MRDIFTQMRTLTTYNKVYNRLGGLRSIYQDVMKEKFWPKNVLLEWLDIYDEAIEKLELLKQSSPESYRCMCFLKIFNLKEVTSAFSK